MTLSDDRVSGDSLTLSYTSASFSDKNAGTGKTVSVSGISVSGTDSGNYTLSNVDYYNDIDMTINGNLTINAAPVGGQSMRFNVTGSIIINTTLDAGGGAIVGEGERCARRSWLPAVLDS